MDCGDDQERLYIAAREGDVKTVESDLKTCSRYDYIELGYALFEASSNGHADICKVLINVSRTDANYTHWRETTSLFEASTQGHVDVCRVLISDGKADVNKAGLGETTALIEASIKGHVEVCTVLINDSKADVNKAGRGEKTPLSVAANKGHVEVCKVLINDGKADVNKFDGSKTTPLFEASTQGHAEVCKILINDGKADVNKAGWMGTTPLIEASTQGHVDVCRVLINDGKADVNKADWNGRTPLIEASTQGHVEMCKVLINDGKADVNELGWRETTPLIEASTQGHVEVCKVLINDGKADVNESGWLGTTPLIEASTQGHVDVCKVLINDGKADVKKASWDGSTPLCQASSKGHVDVCKVLINDGKADVNIPDRDGSTSLCQASSKGHVDVCKVLINDGKADVNIPDRDGSTPLCQASSKGHVDVCKVLINDGKADVNIPDRDRRTPLYQAIYFNHANVYKVLINDGNADVNKADANGNTLLHIFAAKEDSILCRKLIDAGIDPLIRNSEGKNALQCWPKDIFQRRKGSEFLEKTIKKAELNLLMGTGSSPVNTVKLFLLGDPRAGKTTLRKTLTKSLPQSMISVLSPAAKHYPTPGINVGEQNIKGAGSFMIWDTAGQIEFRVTHSMLLGGSRGIFIVAFNCSLPDFQKKLMHWLSFIKASNDPAEENIQVILLVGTHLDECFNTDHAEANKIVKNLQHMYCEILNIHEGVILLDARPQLFRSESVKQLTDVLNTVAEPMRGELTPRICDEIKKCKRNWCKGTIPAMSLSEFFRRVRSDIDDKASDELLKLAVGYLHDMGEVHLARMKGKEDQQADDDIIIMEPNWLTTTIFGPIFANPDFRPDYRGLQPKQEYTFEDLKLHFKSLDQDLLVKLLMYFELAFRNDDQHTFIIPAKLPPGFTEICWDTPERYSKYFGVRIQCRDITDIFSVDTFPCLQVSGMNRYRQKGVKPKLSCFGLKVFDEVEGMIQLTKDKRAIHVAVRVREGKEREGEIQIQGMKALVFKQLDHRSKGTNIEMYYLSPNDLRASKDLVENVHYYTEEDVKRAESTKRDLANPNTLVPDSVESVKVQSSSSEFMMITDDDLNEVIDLLGPDQLRKLYAALGLTQSDIDKAKHSEKTSDVDLEAREVLLHWRKTKGAKATRKAIFDALEKCRDMEVKEKLEQKWTYSGSEEEHHQLKDTQQGSVFSKQQEGKSKVMITEQEIKDVIDCLGPDSLKKLYQTLRLRKQDIEKAEYGVESTDVDLKAQAVLLKWRQVEGNNATKEAIIEALERCGNREAVVTLELKWMRCEKAFQQSENEQENESPDASDEDSQGTSKEQLDTFTESTLHSAGLDNLAKGIRPRWRQFAEKLGFDSSQCDKLQGSDDPDDWRPASRMLKAWTDITQAADIDRQGILIDILEQMDMAYLVKDVQNL